MRTWSPVVLCFDNCYPIDNSSVFYVHISLRKQKAMYTISSALQLLLSFTDKTVQEMIRQI